MSCMTCASSFYYQDSCEPPTLPPPEPLASTMCPPSLPWCIPPPGPRCAGPELPSPGSHMPSVPTLQHPYLKQLWCGFSFFFLLQQQLKAEKNTHPHTPEHARSAFLQLHTPFWHPFLQLQRGARKTSRSSWLMFRNSHACRSCVEQEAALVGVQLWISLPVQGRESHVHGGLHPLRLVHEGCTPRKTSAGNREHREVHEMVNR